MGVKADYSDSGVESSTPDPLRLSFLRSQTNDSDSKELNSPLAKRVDSGVEDSILLTPNSDSDSRFFQVLRLTPTLKLAEPDSRTRIPIKYVSCHVKLSLGLPILRIESQTLTYACRVRQRAYHLQGLSDIHNFQPCPCHCQPPHQVPSSVIHLKSQEPKRENLRLISREARSNEGKKKLGLPILR